VGKYKAGNYCSIHDDNSNSERIPQKLRQNAKAAFSFQGIKTIKPFYIKFGFTNYNLNIYTHFK